MVLANDRPGIGAKIGRHAAYHLARRHSDVDPYYNSLRTGMVVAFQAFDCLIYRDPGLDGVQARTGDGVKQSIEHHRVHPASGRDVPERRSLHRRRRRVHDHTIIPDKQVAIPAYYTSYAGAEKIDDFHVRLKLTGISPAVMEYLAMMTPIWPKAYREKIGADAYARAPIDTGPYKITKVDGTTESTWSAMTAITPGSPKGKPAIRFIKIHEVPDATTEITELLSGEGRFGSGAYKRPTSSTTSRGCRPCRRCGSASCGSFS